MFSKKNIILYLGLLLFIVIILNSPTNSTNNIGDSVLTQKNTRDKHLLVQPKSSDGIRFYRSNPLYLINDPFDNLNNWDTFIESGSSDVTLNGGGVRLEITAGGTHTANMTYNKAIQRFIHGNITFTYGSWSGSGTLRLSVSLNGVTNWQYIGSAITGGSGTFYVNLESLGYSNEASFYVALNFTGGNNDRVNVDNFRLGIYEICSLEQSDPIEPTVSQTISSYISPDPRFTGLNVLTINNVSLFYKVNDNQVTTGTRIVSGQSSNNWTFTIPQSAYDSSDTVYYQIWLTYGRFTLNKTYHTSNIFRFTCFDRAAPTIQIQGNNATTYYKDVLIRCYVVDNTNGVGLKNVTMYIKNSSQAYDTDGTLILSNRSASIPVGGGNFGFTIPHKYLSARTGYELHYKIYAEDLNSNKANSADAWLTITDDVKPSIIYVKDNSIGGTIDCNKSLIVTYKITEPPAGRGLASAYLYVKIGTTPPSSGNDYSLTPITPDGGIGSLDGGSFNFTVSELNYKAGNNIYYFVNATDLSSNTNSSYLSYKQRTISDNTAPQVSANPLNLVDGIYNVSKTLNFTLYEPPAGSGIDNNTLLLYYKINDPTLTSPSNIKLNVSKYGGIILFTIGEGNYTYADRVYFKLNVSDLIGNKYSSPIYSFYVNDPYKPTVNSYIYSNPVPQYYENFNITIGIWEDSDGSHFSKVDFYVKNLTMTNWIKIFKTNRTSVIGFSGLVYIEFEINSSLLYSRYVLDWRVNVSDIANNIRTYSNSITIHDNRPPSILYSNNNATISLDTFEYDEYPRINFIFYEPKQGSGFYTNGNGITLYYKIGISPANPSDISGTVILFEGSINDFGGNFSFRLPENALNYSKTIWYWVNGSDMQGNLNSTWNNRKSISVVDITSPLISLSDSLNNQSISYHLDKNILFTPSEPSDASLLRNATLYWRINYTASITVYDGFLFLPLSGKGSLSSFSLSHLSPSFKYGNRIYIIIRIFDIANNSRISAINVFNITDLVNPGYSESSDNTDDWTWRVNRELVFTVFDPAYPTSSGITAITLYYRAGAAPTTSTYDNRTVVYSGVITKAGKVYTIILYLNQTLYNKSPTIYYFIRIMDVAGNSNNSIVRSFVIYEDVFQHGSVQGPESGEWLTVSQIHFYFYLFFTTNMWITINDELYNYTISLIEYDDIIEFGEGNYLVEFKFLNNFSIRAFSFSVDLYAPSQITGVDLTIYGFEVVKLEWEAPKGADSETIYKIYRSTDPDFKVGEDMLLKEIGIDDALSYEDGNVEPSTTYYYIIIAIDRVGHVSKPSESLKAKIPANPLIPILVIVTIGAIAGISMFVVKRKVSKNKTTKLLSQVNMDEIEKKYGQSEIKPKKSAGWTEIKTKTEYKPREASEIEFVEETPVESAPTIETGAYWHERMAKLVGLGSEFEQSNDYGKTIRVYSILARISKRTRKNQMRQLFQEKQNDIYREISK